jgi:hypothetical protein
VVAPLGIATSLLLLASMGWAAIGRIAAWQLVGALVLFVSLRTRRDAVRLYIALRASGTGQDPASTNGCLRSDAQATRCLQPITQLFGFDATIGQDLP